MKIIFLVSTILATATASWESIHGKYNGPLYYPKIHKGVPIEPAAVQHAREAHLKVLSHASHDHHNYDYDHHKFDNHHETSHKWHGQLHYPKIHNGVPVEPKEVQHARKAHLYAVAHAKHGDYHNENNYNNHKHDYNDRHYEQEYVQKWYGSVDYPKIYSGVPVEPKEVQQAREMNLNAYSNGQYQHYHYEIPKIGHDGKPQDTHEVEAAKAKHFAAFHNALAKNTHHYRQRRGASSYVHFSSDAEHEVPVYHYENKMINNAYNHGNSHGYSYKQTHAQVYGHHEEYNRKGHKLHSYEKISFPVFGHYEHQFYKQNIPVIGLDGTPIDTPEVQHAKEAHFAAHAAAKLNNH